MLWAGTTAGRGGTASGTSPRWWGSRQHPDDRQKIAFAEAAGAGLREPFSAEVHRVNPTCGDEVRLRVHLTGEGAGAVLVDVSYEALGCSISVAATSVMVQEVTGRPVADGLAAYERFHQVVTVRSAVVAPGEAVTRAS